MKKKTGFFEAAESDVISLCDELFSNSPIKYFSHVTVTPDAIFPLFTHVDYLKYSLEKGYAPSFEDLKKRPEICLINPEIMPRNIQDSMYKNLKYMSEHVGTYQIITLKNVVDEHIEISAFAIDKNFSDPINYYFNNIEKLKDFVFDFKKQGEKLIKKARSIENIIKIGSLEKNKVPPTSTNINNTLIKIKGLYGDVFITKRELGCLHYLLMGYTAKQIASYINLSYRTVENIFYRIRQKIGCQSKNELITILRKNNFETNELL